MIRARFHAAEPDYRPSKWPLKHPYWCTGYGEGYSTIVAYADSEEQILEHWPEANNIDSEECDEYCFTERFPRPDWFQEPVEVSDR